MDDRDGIVGVDDQVPFHAAGPGVGCRGRRAEEETTVVKNIKVSAKSERKRTMNVPSAASSTSIGASQGRVYPTFVWHTHSSYSVYPSSHIMSAKRHNSDSEHLVR